MNFRPLRSSSRRSTILLLLFVVVSTTATTGAAAVPQIGDEVCVAGPVMDEFCLTLGTLFDNDEVATLSAAGPVQHTVHCLIDVDVCRESPFEVLVAREDGSYDRAWRLQNNAKVVRHARAVGSCATCNGGYSKLLTKVQQGYRATVQGTVVALARDDGTPAVIDVTEVADFADFASVCTDDKRCEDRTGCQDCLEHGCARTVGGCVPDCASVADAPCLRESTEMSADALCAIEEIARQNYETCSALDILTCTECTAVTILTTELSSLHSANNNCMWFEQGGYCGVECDIDGCGITDNKQCPQSTSGSPGVVPSVMGSLWLALLLAVSCW